MARVSPSLEIAAETPKLSIKPGLGALIYASCCQPPLPRLNFLESLSTDEFTQKPSMHPELVGIWISYVKNEVSSTKRILINLRAGKYAFKSKITKEHENEIS